MAPRLGELDQRVRALEAAMHSARERVAGLQRALAARPRLDLGRIVPGGSDEKQLLIELEGVRAELDHARTQLAEKTRAAAENEHELSLQVSALRDTLELTQQQLEQARAAQRDARDAGETTEVTPDLRARVRDLEAQVRAGIETIERLHRAGQQKVDQLSELQSQIQREQFELEQLRDAKQNLHGLLDEWRQRARVAERDRDSARARAEQATATVTSLRTELSQSQSAAQQLREQVTELRREVERMERRTEHLRQHLRQGGG